MAKKAELLEQAKKLKLEVSEKNTIAEIEKAIKGAPIEKKSVEREAKTAKAGKRSEKGQKEAEEKTEKIEKQHHREESESPKDEKKPKKTVKPTRTKLERRSKAYRKAAENIDKTKEYSLKEALELAQGSSTVKFDASIELHVRLNVDPKQADQNIRESIVLPAGTGKTARVAVFADGDDIKKAKDAGADIAAGDELLQQLDKEEINFDVLVATPKVMAKLGKYARVLGPKGLMPNPKSGTVAADVAKAVKEAKGGKVEYRVDSAGIVHLNIGKVSFSVKDLEENAIAVLASIKAAKPSSIKGSYLISMYLTTTMGPSVKLAPSELK